MRRLAVWLMMLAVLMPGRVSAEGPERESAFLEALTQEEAVRAALSRHPKIHQAQARMDQARARLSESRRWFRPRISVSAGERLDTEGHRAGIQISHDLDDLWNHSKVRNAEAELAISEQDLFLTRQAVVEEVVSAYSRWALAREERQRISRRIVHARRALHHAHQKYEEGLISRAQLTELEQSLDTAQQAQQETFARLVQSAVRLRQAMGELGVL